MPLKQLPSTETKLHLARMIRLLNQERVWNEMALEEKNLINDADEHLGRLAPDMGFRDIIAECEAELNEEQQ